MTIIETPDEDEATGEVARIYAADIKDLGYAASHTRVMSVNPEAYAGWEQLIRGIVSQLGKRRYELVTLAAAAGAALAGLPSRSRAQDARTDRRRAARTDRPRLPRRRPSEAEVAMMEYAERVVTASADMTEDDSLRLRELGFTDREIVDITLAASARGFFSRSLQALAVEPDTPPDLPERLRGALLAPL